MNSFKTCCKGCLNRHPKCHADCPKKAAQDAEREELKKKQSEKLPLYAYSRDRRVIVEKKVRRHGKK